MGLETICGHVELERAHRTPSKAPSASEKRLRPMHIAFLRYTDKMKVLRNAAARLKDNPLNGSVITQGVTGRTFSTGMKRIL